MISRKLIEGALKTKSFKSEKKNRHELHKNILISNE